MLTTIASSLRRFLHRITAAVTIVIRWGQSVWEGIRDRHLERSNADPGYRSALASGATALISVVTASPALAAAFGVWVGEHLRVPSSRLTHRSGPSRLWDEDWDDDEVDPLTTPRAWGYRR